MRRLTLTVIGLVLLGGGSARADGLTVGSKSFTESVILGEIMAGLARDAGIAARHRAQLGGTRILWNALKGGEIDAYPEYTGTIAREILAADPPRDAAAMRRQLGAHGIAMSRPIGFNNTYALAMKPALADRLGIESISDLARHPKLRLGFSNEFMDRGDGWPALRRRYALPQSSVRGIDHDLAYRGLAAGDLDAIDIYTTDAEIAYYGLRLLTDDRGHFPAYDAVLLYRADLAARLPGAVRALRRIEGRIGAERMVALNAQVKLDGRTERAAAAGFLQAMFGIAPQARDSSLWTRLVDRTAEHLILVGISLAAAILAAIPLGIWAARRPRFGQAVLGVVGIAQTIPGLALLVFMIPLLGIGGPPAIAALFLYSLLPIVRNTHAGLVGIDAALIDSADALGLPSGARLRLVELPLALPAILAGIKTSAVINIGTATLGALIGAGGYGQPILTGIRLDNMGLILEGAVPAAGLAIIAQLGFDAIERRLVPKGLRLAA